MTLRLGCLFVRSESLRFGRLKRWPDFYAGMGKHARGIKDRAGGAGAGTQVQDAQSLKRYTEYVSWASNLTWFCLCDEQFLYEAQVALLLFPNAAFRSRASCEMWGRFPMYCNISAVCEKLARVSGDVTAWETFVEEAAAEDARRARKSHETVYGSRLILRPGSGLEAYCSVSILSLIAKAKARFLEIFS